MYISFAVAGALIFMLNKSKVVFSSHALPYISTQINMVRLKKHAHNQRVVVTLLWPGADRFTHTL